LACLLWSRPAWKMAARDSWIDWTNEERTSNLKLVENNSRFLTLPWVRVRYIASTILSWCARQLPADWEGLYGYCPLLLETLVDLQVRGTSHKASNWIYPGRDAGTVTGRMDQHPRIRETDLHLSSWSKRTTTVETNLHTALC
jgi:hypothetical protein